jgi:hypothetical protein
VSCDEQSLVRVNLVVVSPSRQLPHDRLIGLITSETIGEMLVVQEAMPQGTRFGPWSRPGGGVSSATGVSA